MNYLIVILISFFLTSMANANELNKSLENSLNILTNQCEKIDLKVLHQRMETFDQTFYDLAQRMTDKQFLEKFNSDEVFADYIILYGYSYIPKGSMKGGVAKSCGVYYTEFSEALKINKEAEASQAINSWRACLESSWGHKLPELAKPIIECYQKIK